MAVHPVVRVHPLTGRRALYVNEHFTRRIVEMNATESDMLLRYLTKWVSNPRFTVRYRWTEGTIAMWDNRCTQHFVLNDFVGERIIQRVTVMGDKPIGLAAEVGSVGATGAVVGREPARSAAASISDAAAGRRRGLNYRVARAPGPASRLSAHSTTVVVAGRGANPSTRRAFSAVSGFVRPRNGVIHFSWAMNSDNSLTTASRNPRVGTFAARSPRFARSVVAMSRTPAAMKR